MVHANIPKFPQAGPQNHEPDRRRRLLMSRRELDSWSRRAHEKGFSVIPLRLYFRGPWVKLEIGLGKGQKRYDKREKIREKTDRREAQRALGAAENNILSECGIDPVSMVSHQA